MEHLAAERWPRTDRQRLLFLLLFTLGLAVAFILLAMTLGRALGRPAGQIVVTGIAAVAVVALFRRFGVSPAALGLRSERLGAELGLGVLATAVVSGVLLGLIAIFSGTEAVRETLSTITGYGATERLTYLAVGLGAAFTEEPIFRGYLQPLLMRMTRFGVGLALTSLVFALIHAGSLRWPPIGFLGKLSIGLAAGVLRGRDRPLTGALVAHALVWAVWGDA